MSDTLDLAVIGTGAGASTVANKCRGAGWSVAVVDDRPYGGTCALRGCDPKKVLVAASEAIDGARRLKGRGVSGDLELRWSDLMRFKRSFTEPVPESRERSFASRGIEAFHGHARFVGPTSLVVGDRSLEARHVHIASGAKPRPLPIPGAELLTTSDQFLDLDSLPDRVVFLGSGYISFEFAHIARTAGAKVTMLEMLERPLAGFEPRLVDLLVERTLGMGIELRLGTRVDAIEERREGLRVRATSRSERLAIDADLVVHGAGRVPDLGDLELEKAAVEYDEAGVLVNEYMQSVSNPAVYAAGDAAKAGLPLTPVASFQAHIAAANLLEGNHRRAEHPPIPSVVFTSPPLASVGLLPEEAKRQELKFATPHARTADWYSSRRVGEESSGYTVLVEEGSGRILGAHVLGPHAEELINLFAMAMRCRLSSTDVKELILAYPTAGSDMPHMV